MLENDREILANYIKSKVGELKHNLEELEHTETKTEIDRLKKEGKMISTQTTIDYYLSRLNALGKDFSEEVPKR